MTFFFGHFKNVLVYDRKKTGFSPGMVVVRCKLKMIDEFFLTGLKFSKLICPGLKNICVNLHYKRTSMKKVGSVYLAKSGKTSAGYILLFKPVWNRKL